MKEKKNKWPLIILALVAIVATTVYSASSFYQFKKGIPEERPEFGPPPGDRGPGGRGRGPEGRRGGPPSEEERQQRFQEMSKELQLTAEQQSQIREIMSQPWERGREGGRERFQQMRDVLTPEQQQMMSTRFQSRMDARMQRRLNEARKSLPEKEVKVLEEQMKERRKQMEERRRRGEGPPGPPPFGGPPPGGGPDGPPPPPPPGW